MNQVHVLLYVVLVITHSWTIRAGIVPGIMDLLNMDATTPPIVRTWEPTKLGQVNSPRCASTRYGCCKDWHTPSPDANEEGCVDMLCYDKDPVGCYNKKFLHVLDCSRGGYDRKNCARRCDACKLPAQPLMRCQQVNPSFGCCWDGTISLDRNGRGCRACEDFFPHVCSQFVQGPGGCDSGSFFIREFMMTKCPRTCGLCAGGL